MTQSSTLSEATYEGPTTEQITVAAFHLYLERGGGEGDALDDWLRAEELLTQKLREIITINVLELQTQETRQTVAIRWVTTEYHFEKTRSCWSAGNLESAEPVNTAITGL